MARVGSGRLDASQRGGRPLIIVSLVLNIAVLIAVAGSLLTDASWIRSAYGDRTPARDILVAIYLAILIASVGLLVGDLVAPAAWMLGAIVGLLGVQIVYKVLTALTVRSAFRNPVVLSNLGIALVHAATIATVVPLLG